jgi:hypothetical protein
VDGLKSKECSAAEVEQNKFQEVVLHNQTTTNRTYSMLPYFKMVTARNLHHKTTGKHCK